MINKVDSKTMLHNYIYRYFILGELSYVGSFPLYLRMAQIFTDFCSAHGCGKSVNIRAILRYNGKIPT